MKRELVSSSFPHGAPGVRTPGAAGTLLLSRSDVERLLTPDACIDAVEDAFRQHALGKTPSPGILGFHAQDGSFHIKAALLTLDQPYFAAKTNANFPRNGALHGLPTIQGVVVLCDAVKGLPLAVMDSMAITALRTAAATAVAAKYLARQDCETVLICGCGGQAPAQLRALLRVRSLARVYAYDQDKGKAQAFAAALGSETGLPIEPVADLAQAVAASDIVITCTTARRYFIERGMVRPGTFVAGVGADNENKQELDPMLLARSKLVTDITGAMLRDRRPAPCGCGRGDVPRRCARRARRDHRGAQARTHERRRSHRFRFKRHGAAGRRSGGRRLPAGARARRGHPLFVQCLIFSRRNSCVTNSHPYIAVPGS